MKTYLLRQLTPLMMGVWLTSCNPGTYVSAYQNVPLLQQKGEVQAVLNGTNLHP
ncbi:hypothetical protein [Fibrella arboris]|uniref:hypothetical protein n=1 Tax=Fibrella arboris TaxID=3242486 RepID=UPI0035227812